MNGHCAFLLWSDPNLNEMKNQFGVIVTYAVVTSLLRDYLLTRRVVNALIIYFPYFLNVVQVKLAGHSVTHGTTKKNIIYN